MRQKHRIIIGVLAALLFASPAMSQKKPRLTKAQQKVLEEKRARAKAEKDSIKARMNKEDNSWNKFVEETEEEWEKFRRECNEKYASLLEGSWTDIKDKKKEPLEKPKDLNSIDPKERQKQMMAASAVVSDAPLTDAGFSLKRVVKSIKKVFSSKPKPDPIYKRAPTTAEKPAAPKAEPKKIDDKFDNFFKEEKKPEIKAEKKPELPAIQPAKPAPDPSKVLTFMFYGTPMYVNIGEITKKLTLPQRLPNNDHKLVADAWRTCSSKPYDPLLDDCLRLKEEHKLGDWAYLRMLQIMAETWLGKDNNATTFLIAYLYCQSGYKIMLGENNGELLMLFASPHAIYGKGRFDINGTHYYVLNDRAKTFYYVTACDQEFTGTQPMSLLIDESPVLTKNISDVLTIASPKYPDVSIDVAVNKNLLDFYADYPSSEYDNNMMTKWQSYAEAAWDEDVFKQIVPALKKKLAGLSEKEQIERLLDLMQSGLEYEYDDVVWGYDRAFFAEETLFYPKCDCEDHAILFVKLVKEVTGLKSGLVYYPASAGHLAAAVHFTDPTVTGDYLLADGERYYICDPTNIVPRPGVTMTNPFEDNSQASIILMQ